jgi:hypothetical protein
LAHDRPAEQHEAEHEDERDRGEQHPKAVCTGPLARLAEGTEREVESDGPDAEDKKSNC